MPEIKTLDLPGIYRAIDDTKARRLQNNLYQQQSDRQGRINELLPQAAGGDQAAMTGLAGVSPQDAASLVTLQGKQAEMARANLKELGAAATWADTPEKWNQAIDFLGPQFNQYRDQFQNRGAFMSQIEAMQGMVGSKAQSPLGKLKADLSSGLMTPEQYDAAVAKANAPRGPLVKIENQGQTIDNKLLDMDLETISGTRDQVKAGEDFMPRLEVIVQGLESGNVETGRWQEATLPIRQWAQSAGWADDPTLGEQEAVLAAISYMIPRMRVVGSGQTSDVEIRLFSQATAQYSNTPQGNILIARTMMQLQDRNKELLTAQRAWVRKNKTLEGFDADKEIGPMFPKVTSQEDADKLPSGAVFIYTPNGRFMVKQ